MSAPHIKKALGGIALKALLALFLLPGFTLGFAHFLVRDADTTYRQAIIGGINEDKALSADERQQAIAFFDHTAPSAACFSEAAELARYREGVCDTYSPLWQFMLTRRVALITVLANLALLLTMVALGALAFSDRTRQYASFVFGWRLLTFASAAQLLIQGVFAVWLSFWLTAHFFEVYILKLILFVAIGVGIAVLTAVGAIFRRVPRDNRIEGELITPEQAPLLWQRIRDFAAHLNTPPPAQIIAGIDANFFVTEAPLKVDGRETRGRTLYLSLPLLRQLEHDEAGAVFAHELGHFSGGDTASSAALGPKLAQYDFYAAQLYAGGAARIAFYLLNLYRVIFEIALQQSSRQREFAADGVAAQLTSPKAVVQALVKVSAYAQYRSQIEQGLFAQDEQHSGALGIGQRVASGLAAFGRSAEFTAAMREAAMPHPFDSHPPLQQRMQHVGHVLREFQFAALVCQKPQQPWTSDIVDVDAIEQRLWRTFEQQFSQAHEETLAYRYEPANETELALVLRYFPTVRFGLAKGAAITVTYAGLELPEQTEILGWDRVKTLQYDDASLGGDRLTIGHPEKGWLGAKSTKVSLKFANKDRERFKQTLGRYWQRHQVMRAQQAQG